MDKLNEESGQNIGEFNSLTVNNYNTLTGLDDQLLNSPHLTELITLKHGRVQLPIDHCYCKKISDQFKLLVEVN